MLYNAVSSVIFKSKLTPPFMMKLSKDKSVPLTNLRQSTSNWLFLTLNSYARISFQSANLCLGAGVNESAKVPDLRVLILIRRDR